MASDRVLSWHQSLAAVDAAIEVFAYDDDDDDDADADQPTIFARFTRQYLGHPVMHDLFTCHGVLCGRVFVTSHTPLTVAPYVWHPSPCHRFASVLVGSTYSSARDQTSVQIETFTHAAMGLARGDGCQLEEAVSPSKYIAGIWHYVEALGLVERPAA